VALATAAGNALYQRILYWRLGRMRRAALTGRTVAMRRNDTSVVQTPDTGERQAKSLGGRLAVVGTRDLRRRGPATRLLRAHLAEASADAHDAVVGNLRRCLSAAAVAAVLDDITAKGPCGQRQLAAVLNRLVELEAIEADVKRVLAYGGLAATHEMQVERRVIKLKFDPVSGTMEWRHRAVRSIGFSGIVRGLIAGRLRERSRLRVLIHLDGAGRVVGWDLPAENPTRI